MNRAVKLNAARAAALAMLVALGVASIIGSGGGGGGDDEGQAPSVPTTVNYALDAPQDALLQTPLTITLPGSNAVIYAKGPDGNINLPKISGTFDTLSSALTASVGSKIWLDLPQAVASAKISVATTQTIESYLADDPSAGALTITPRAGDQSGLTGTLRLRFNIDCAGTMYPFRIEWDSNNDGNFEQSACHQGGTFTDLWNSGSELYQRMASAAYLGWSSLYSEFDFSVAALRIVESNYAAIAAAPAGVSTLAVSCHLYPPTQSAGSYALSWIDSNGTGAFDTGDTVRMLANSCWMNDPGDPQDLRVNGIFELRNYARNVGAAPTFLSIVLTPTLENPAGTFTDQAAISVSGGFTLNAPGIAPSATTGGALGAFNFTNGNMLAAAKIAASSASFFPTESQVTLAVVERLRAGGTPPFTLNVCENPGAGSATLLWADMGASGFSAGDSASLELGNCNLDGTLTGGHIVYDFTSVTPIAATADVTLQGLATTSTTKSGGYSGKMGVTVIENNGTRSVEHVPGTANGVVTATASGQNVWQLGCFDVIYGDQGIGTPYTLVNPGVIKASNKIMSITGGSSLFLQFQLATPDYLNQGGFTLVSFSLPECAALGVPNGVGDSDGNYVVVMGSSPNDNIDDLQMTLYNKANVILGSSPTSWHVLVE